MVPSPWCSIIPSFMGYLMKQNSPLVFEMSLPSNARGCLLKIMSAWTKVSCSVDKMEAKALTEGNNQLKTPGRKGTFFTWLLKK